MAVSGGLSAQASLAHRELSSAVPHLQLFMAFTLRIFPLPSIVSCASSLPLCLPLVIIWNSSATSSSFLGFCYCGYHKGYYRQCWGLFMLTSSSHSPQDKCHKQARDHSELFTVPNVTIPRESST